MTNPMASSTGCDYWQKRVQGVGQNSCTPFCKDCKCFFPVSKVFSIDLIK